MGSRVIVTRKGDGVQVVKKKAAKSTEEKKDVVKKKRGRPRKHPEKPAANFEEKKVKSTPELDALFKKSEQKKEEIKAVEPEVLPDKVEEPKKRGRPKKAQEHENPEDLPHLYGFKWYPWAWEFFTSTNKNCFLNAANQASKSSTQIRKIIHWATCPDLWPKLWKTKPRTFWYLYPSLTVASAEFAEKWEPEFMPRGDYKDHPIFGWKRIDKFGSIHCVKFNSGVTIYFKSYEQKKTNVQSSSVWYVACDEELPTEYWPEINARRTAVTINGYFSMVFTATIGQIFWYETMECIGKSEERFKKALKRQVSLYDCLKYKDGTKSGWTNKRIQEIKDDCESENEILRRVFGRFVPDKSMLFDSFDEKSNQIPNFPIPANWDYHLGVFLGKVSASVVLMASSQKRDKFLIKESICMSPRIDLIRDGIEKVVRDLPITSKYTNSTAFSNVLLMSAEFFEVVPTPTEGFQHMFNDLFLNKKLFLLDDNNSLALCFRTMKTEDISKWIGYEKLGASFLIISQIYFPVEPETAKKKSKRPQRRWEKDYDPEFEPDGYEVEFSEINDQVEEYYG